MERKADRTANRLMALGVVALVLLGGYFRTYRLAAPSFWMDEAFSVRTARAILETGAPRLETGATVSSWLPAHYLMAGALRVFPEMHFAARLPSALAGAGLIALTGLLAYQLTRSRLAAVLAAFFVAFSVPDIAWSRQARGYVLLQTLGVGALTLALWETMRPAVGRWLGAGALLALAILTHRAGYVYWLMCAGILVLETPAIRREGVPPVSRLAWPARVAVAGLLLLPLLAGWLLPVQASQGLAETVAAFDAPPFQPSYARQYLALIQDFWRWNCVWMAAGAAGLIVARWRAAVPVALAVAAYLFVLSEKTLWFHVRYLVPILPFLHVAVAAAMAWTLLRLRAWSRSRAERAAWTAIVCAVCVATSFTQNLTVLPDSEYELGPTEPQADWQDAFGWLKARKPPPTTIMALPVFHDLYLGPAAGKKYFLPFTFTRVPGEWQTNAPYAVAAPVRDLAELQSLAGYVVLDGFSFASLRDPEIQAWLDRRPPVYATPDGSVLVWRLP